MTFTEELGGNISPDQIRIRDADDPSGPYLQGAVRTAVSGDSVAIWLNSTQMAAVEALARPVLDIGAGAVSDVAGNPAPRSIGRPIDVVSHTLTRVGELPDRVKTAYLYESGGHQYAAMTQYEIAGTGDMDITSIYNASDPLRPRLLGTAYEGNSADDLDTVDHFEHGGRTYLVIVNPSGFPHLAVVNVTDPHRVETVSQIDSIGIGYAVTAKIFWRDGIPYMSAISDNAALIFNMSDPASPAEVGVYPDIGFQGGVDHFESGGSTYAFLSSGHALSVFDVSDPAKPVMTDAMLGTIRHVETFGRDGGSFVLVGQLIIDVTDPHDIALVGSAGAPSGRYGAPSALAVGERLYAITFIEHLLVLDISDPFEPKHVVSSDVKRGNLEVGYTGIHQAGNKTYVYAGGGIHLFEEYLPTVPVPPELESALYNPANRFVQLSFSEPVRRDAGDVHIRPAGDSTGGVALAGTPVVKGGILTFKLTAGQADMVDAMGAAIEVDMGRGAVRDLAGTFSGQSYDNPVTIRDSTPPRPISAAFDMDGRNLAVTFDEPLNGTVRPGGISVLGDPQLRVERYEHSGLRYMYSGDHLSLTGFNPEVSGSTVTYTLDRDAADRLVVMVRPTLNVAGPPFTNEPREAPNDPIYGAGLHTTGPVVFDVAGNPAPASLYVPVTVRDDAPPTVSVAYFDGGTLRVVFSESMASSPSPVVRVHDGGDVSIPSLNPSWVSGDEASITLTRPQVGTINGMAGPLLDVEAGTAADLFGNPLGRVADVPVLTHPLYAHSWNHHNASSATWRGADITAVDDAAYAVVPDASGFDIFNVTGSALDLAVSGEIDPAGSADSRNVEVFGVDDATYALLALRGYDATTLYNVSDISAPAAVRTLFQANASHYGTTLALSGAHDVSVFEAAGRLHAAIAAEGGVQTVLLEGGALAPAGALDTGITGEPTLDTITIDGRVYALVAGGGGFLVLNVTNPAAPVQVAAMTPDASYSDVATFSVDGRHYAAVGTNNTAQVSIFDITDPSEPASVTSKWLYIRDADTFLDVLEHDRRTYLLVGYDGRADPGSSPGHISIIDVTQPARGAHILAGGQCALERAGCQGLCSRRSDTRPGLWVERSLPAVCYRGRYTTHHHLCRLQHGDGHPEHHLQQAAGSDHHLLGDDTGRRERQRRAG